MNHKRASLATSCGYASPGERGAQQFTKQNSGPAANPYSTAQTHHTPATHVGLHLPSASPVCRKFSREVSYSVVDTLRKAHVYDPAAAAALVATRDAARAAAAASTGTRAGAAAAGEGQAAQLEGAGFAASGVATSSAGGRSDPWVAEAARRLDASAARLAALRELYEKEVGPGVPLSGAVLAVANSGPGGTGSVRGKAAAAAAGAAEGPGDAKAQQDKQ